MAPRAALTLMTFTALLLWHAPAARGQCTAPPWRTVRASNGADFDLFGASVAIHDDVLVVGAPAQDDVAPDAGLAYVFRTPDGGASWVEEQQLIAPGGGASDYFGVAVATTGSIAVVGAAYLDAPKTDSGAVYVYVFQGSVWTLHQILVPSDPSDRALFGNSVACDRDVIVVGAVGDGKVAPRGGAAYVFRLQGSTWIQEAKLLPGDLAGGDAFGNAVSIDGDVVVVGAPFHDHTVTDAGAAYVFRRTGSTWSQEQELFASNHGAHGHFGFSASVSGTDLAIGAPDPFTPDSTVTVFRDSGTWQEVQKLSARCVSIDLSGDRLATSGDGFLFVFSLELGTWLLRFRSSSTGYDGAVAVDGDLAVAGAPTLNHTPIGQVDIFAAQDLALLLDPATVPPGGLIDLRAYCALDPVLLLAVEAIDGVPVFGIVMLVHAQGLGFDGIRVPPELAHLSFTLRAFTTNLAGGIMASNAVVLRIL